MAQTAFKQVADNAVSTTSTTLTTTGVTSIVLASNANFPTPGNGFIATLWNGSDPSLDANMEKVTVTANASGTLTCSATTKTHTSPTYVGLLNVAQNISDLQTAVNTLELGGGSGGSSSFTSPLTVTTQNANALAVGQTGATNPAFNVNTSTGSTTGVSITAKGANNGVDITVTSSSANESMAFYSKGSATTFFGSSTNPILIYSSGALTSRDSLVAGSTTGMTAGGSLKGLQISSVSAFGVFAGSGAPTITAAQGSLYLRSDGSSTSTRAYISLGGGTWTALTTAS